MPAILGIDLGTTFSVVATLDEIGRPSIVHNPDGVNITPSCVTESDGVIEVGEFARRMWGNAPTRAAARFKRDMGTSATYSINGQEFTPTELSAFVLKKLVKDARSTLGEIGDAVVTIPANFAHEARDATMSAAKAAGLNVKFIVNEPTAAALFYAFQSGEELSGNYAVYDLGGGTFDISIIRVHGQNVEVLATNGVAKLGGDDFDLVIVEIVSRKFRDATGRDIDPDDFTTTDAEEEKKSLSRRTRTTTRVGRQLVELSREEFEEAISSRVAQTEMLCEATINEAGLDVSDIRGIFLAGGSTRIPMVQESVERVFGKKPLSSFNVDEVVALGACLYAAFRSDRSTLTTVQRNAIGSIKVAESTSKCFGTFSVGRNEARGEEVLTNSIMIRKGNPIPCSVTESFYTMHDNQQAVGCEVTESTSPETDPRFVKLIWSGKLRLPEGRPAGQEIKVTFAYDENQVMKCSFIDSATGARTAIDLSMAASSEKYSEIDKFLVE